MRNTYGLSFFALLIVRAYGAPVVTPARSPIFNQDLAVVLARDLLGFGGPLNRPAIDTTARTNDYLASGSADGTIKGSTPVGDFCASASLNEHDKALCRDNDAPKKPQKPQGPAHPEQREPTATTTTTMTTTTKNHDAPKHTTTVAKEDGKDKQHTTRTNQYRPVTTPPVKPQPTPTPCTECDQAEPLLHVGADVPGLLKACIDVLGDSGSCQQQAQPHVPTTAMMTKTTSAPIARPTHSLCDSGYRFSPVLSVCVALLPDAPRPYQGKCPTHWAYDWQLELCVAIADDAPRPSNGRCPTTWGYDWILEVCVSLDVDHKLGNHVNAFGAPVAINGDAVIHHVVPSPSITANLQPTGVPTPAPVPSRPSCPPGQILDTFIGCIAPDAAEIL